MERMALIIWLLIRWMVDTNENIDFFPQIVDYYQRFVKGIIANFVVSCRIFVPGSFTMVHFKRITDYEIFTFTRTYSIFIA